MLFCLDRLMQSVTVSSALHDTTSKFIDNQNFVILDYIVDVLFHDEVSAKGVVDMMVQFKIVDIRQIFKFEITFRFADA